MTLMKQLAPDGKLEGQLLDCTASPPFTMPEMVSNAVPPLLSVTTCGGLVVPTTWPEKVRLEVESPMPGAPVMPTPDNAILCGLPAALSAMVMLPLRGPTAVGRK